MDQWTEQSPEINPYTYSQLIYSKRIKNTQWGKDNTFSKQCWKSWTAAYKSLKSEHTLTSYTKINSKWLKEVKYKT